MKQKEKVLVIIPAYNESENIVQVVNHMMEQAPQYDYLVVNDGSTDDTLKLCRRENFQYLDLSINMGIGGAVQMVISMRARMIMTLRCRWTATGSMISCNLTGFLNRL